jgi:hypothetical protein
VPRTTIEVAADLVGMAAAMDLFLPIPLIERGDHSRAPDFGDSYELILSIFR